MLIAILLAAGLAWWLHQRGELLPMLQPLLFGGAALLLTVRMLETGKPLAALLIAGAAGFGWWHWRRRATTRADTALNAANLAQARALLGVGDGADVAAIRTAWLQQMATAHPDRGGSAALAAQLTAARDLLLAARLKG